jgi:hypothetical protein
MSRYLTVALIAAVFACHPANAVAAPLLMECAPDAQPTEPCLSVHGRLYFTNGIPVRIWVVGTKRVLGVNNADQLHPMIQKHLGFGSTLYGDFSVCPLSPDVPGQLRYVCIQSAENLVVQKYDADTDTTRVFKLLSTWPACHQGPAGSGAAPPEQKRTTTPNNAVQRTPGARILIGTSTISGGAPGAADGERWTGCENRTGGTREG